MGTAADIMRQLLGNHDEPGAAGNLFLSHPNFSFSLPLVCEGGQSGLRG